MQSSAFTKKTAGSGYDISEHYITLQSCEKCAVLKDLTFLSFITAKEINARNK